MHVVSALLGLVPIEFTHMLVGSFISPVEFVQLKQPLRYEVNRKDHHVNPLRTYDGKNNDKNQFWHILYWN